MVRFPAMPHGFSPHGARRPASQPPEGFRYETPYLRPCVHAGRFAPRPHDGLRKAFRTALRHKLQKTGGVAAQGKLQSFGFPGLFLPAAHGFLKPAHRIGTGKEHLPLQGGVEGGHDVDGGHERQIEEEIGHPVEIGVLEGYRRHGDEMRPAGMRKGVFLCRETTCSRRMGSE